MLISFNVWGGRDFLETCNFLVHVNTVIVSLLHKDDALIIYCELSNQIHLIQFIQ